MADPAPDNTAVDVDLTVRFGIDKVISVGARTLYRELEGLLVPVDNGDGVALHPLCNVMCEVLLDTAVELGRDGKYRRHASDEVVICGFACRVVNHGSHYQGVVDRDLEGRVPRPVIAAKLGEIWGAEGGGGSFECDRAGADLPLPFSTFETGHSDADLVGKRKDRRPGGETAAGCYRRLHSETAARDRDALQWHKRFFAQFGRRAAGGPGPPETYKGRGYVIHKLRHACGALRAMAKPKNHLKGRLELRVRAALNRIRRAIA